MKLSDIQSKQENQYHLPYHYIPNHDSQQGFSLLVTWSWGAHYLGGLEAVLQAAEELHWSSLCDIGCGDGRFLREVAKRWNEVRLTGIDYSEHAIALAKALNPELDYRAIDIINNDLQETFDLCTMVEVLEHIPPDSIPKFLDATRKAINPYGHLILTVPHSNKRVNEKHFQHFDSSSLANALASSFEVLKIVPFDGRDRVASILQRILGLQGNNFRVVNKNINNWYYQRILHKCLNEQPEEKCGRLLAIAQPR